MAHDMKSFHLKINRFQSTELQIIQRGINIYTLYSVQCLHVTRYVSFQAFELYLQGHLDARLPISALLLQRNLLPFDVHQVYEHFKVRVMFSVFLAPANAGVRWRHILRGRHQFSQEIQASRRRVRVVVAVTVDVTGFQGPIAVVQGRFHRVDTQQGQIVIKGGHDKRFRECRPYNRLRLIFIAHHRRFRLHEQQGDVLARAARPHFFVQSQDEPAILASGKAQRFPSVQ